MQHPGLIIDRSIQDFIPQGLPIPKLRIRERNERENNRNSHSQELFIYACCGKGLNEQGEKAYAHIEEGE